ncbi:MAG: hypothetical protein P1U40_05820 [Coxiellaceae bacterium]|nr:hypothetical protein [Coxiellaceae bacterium]
MRKSITPEEAAANALLAMSQGMNLQLPARQPSFDPTHAATPGRAGFFTHPKRRKPAKTPRSTITGVSWSNYNKKWRTTIGRSTMRCSLGYHETEEEAANMLLSVLNALLARNATSSDPIVAMYKKSVERQATAKKVQITRSYLTTKIEILQKELDSLTASKQCSCKLKF